MYESCGMHNFSYIVFYIYIYIFKCFLTFSYKIGEIHKETHHSKRKRRKSLRILAKTNEIKSFRRILAEIPCVSLCICENHIVWKR